MFDIAICDDDAVFAAAFEKQLSRALDAREVPYRIASFSDPDALLCSVESGDRYGLLFLDVLFAQAERGIGLAAALRETGCDADIIFISTSPDFAVASFDVAPLHYLVKPIADERLNMALARFLDKNMPYLLRFRTNRGYVQIYLEEVTFFEIYSREIVIHKINGTKETCVGTLKELEDRLPAHTFVRPHRSYLVNLDRICEIVRYQIRVSTGDTVPVSKKLYSQVQKAIIDHADRQTVKL